MIEIQLRRQKSRVRRNMMDSMSSVPPGRAGHRRSFGLLLLLALFCLCGVGQAQEDKGPAGPEITGIEIGDSVVKITVNGPMRYQIEKPADPFRIAVDLEGVRVGKFTERISSQKEGISEITPVQIEVPSLASRLDILMQSPHEVIPEQVGSTLVLTFTKPSGQAERRGAETAGAGGEGITLRDGESSSAVREIVEVFFDEDDKGVELIIKADGKLSDPAVSEVDGKMILYFPGVAMRAAVPSQTPYPVRDLRYRIEKEGVKFIIEIATDVKKEVFLLEDEVVLDMPRKERREKRMEAPQREAQREEGMTKTSNNLVSLDFQDADVVAILRLLSDVSDFNVVVHPDVKGKVTMKLNRVPWDQALDIILKTFNLGKSVEGNIIRIAPFSALARENDELAKTKDSEMKAEPQETRIFRISYADAALIEKTVKDSKILSPRGSISYDKRTSSMVVNDVPASFRQIETLLATLDKPTPQVLIEARIVEVNTTSLRDLGIQWGLNYRSPNTLASVGGLSGNPSLTPGPFTGNNFLVDFPASVGPGTGSGMAFGWLNAARTLGLDAQITALETAGRGRIISNPRVVTSDNEKAKIMQGQSVPYAQRTSEGTISAAFKDVALSIEVIPHITPTNSVVLTVNATKEDLVEFRNIGGGDAPLTSKIEGLTKVLIENGETLVIGGIYKRTERTDDSGTPWLMNVPILGNLFKRSKVTDVLDETIIFITPRVIEKP